MSERALAYSEEVLAHRFLVLFEAAGLRTDFGSYLMRSLLSEGCVRYETVEKTHDGLKARLIEREGPTGLIVTTTAVRLHVENETQVLSLTVTDTPAQTAAVLRVLAEGADGGGVDYEPWQALQSWLEGGEHRVAIPFARDLAERVPPVAVRLRRDFAALLSLIRAHAILHRATRERDEHGQIVATLADYAAVRDLVLDVFAEGIEATVAASIQETVTAVAEIATVDEVASVAQVARRLKLDKGAASRRVRRALDAGYLRNLEDRRGRPSRLTVGDPLPEEVAVLPPVDALRDRCTVAVTTAGIEPPSPPSRTGISWRWTADGHHRTPRQAGRAGHRRGPGGWQALPPAR